MNTKHASKACLAILALSIFVAGVSGVTITSDPVGDDFEDDTSGVNPSGSYYTFLESTGGAAFVTNTQAFGGSNSLRINTEGDGAAMNFGTNYDWCSGDGTLSFWFKAVATGGSAVSAYFVITDGEPTGNFDDDSNVPLPAIGMQYFENRLGSVIFKDSGATANGPSGQSALSISEAWYQVVLTRTGDCDGSVPFTLHIYDDTDTLLLTESQTCSPCNFGSAVSTLVWIDAFDGGAGSPTTYVDNIVLDPIQLFTYDTPPGIFGTVTDADGSTRSVDLLIDPSADETTYGPLTYTIERDSGSGYSVLTTTAGTPVENYVRYTDDLVITGDVTYRVAVTDGEVGSYTCTITVNLDTFNDQSGCGSLLDATTENSLTGDDGIVFGGDKQSLATAAGVSTSTLDVLYGFIFVLAFAAIGFGAMRTPGGAAGAGAGVIIAFAFGLWPLWWLLFIGTGVAAVFLIRRQTL